MTDGSTGGCCAHRKRNPMMLSRLPLAKDAQGTSRNTDCRSFHRPEAAIASETRKYCDELPSLRVSKKVRLEIHVLVRDLYMSVSTILMGSKI